jgi:hypothetical protein
MTRPIASSVSAPCGFAMSAPASIKSWQRSMERSRPSIESPSVRAPMNRFGSRRASSAALILASIRSTGTISLPDRYPHRLGKVWSVKNNPETPADSNARTIWRTLLTPPNPVSAST